MKVCRNLIYLDSCVFFFSQIPSSGVHQAYICRRHLLPGADRTKRSDGFWRGKHQGAVAIRAGIHGE